ncbi:MAG TPA: hypothetical protein VJT72_06790 [Pseudonocardiaceae bacterium]|nr:hypothetical protein [Pseudonocardiaceae bacterium]
MTIPLVDNPDEIITSDPGCCGGCGADLSGAPGVTEYRIVTRACVICGATATAIAPACPPA